MEARISNISTKLRREAKKRGTDRKGRNQSSPLCRSHNYTQETERTPPENP